MEFRGVLPIAA